ncbi:MAG: hypothetical protein LKJ21_09515 [Oscillospiraceae bacterium]|nr:hypothetical protein [Oscillospiraceae bacterium]MCI1990760.1 hypothetical protein [Oscillospiraceae bacterium]MCI2035722.1 hypothetical protein [Oscillospiraceae bacterium]
MDRQSQKNRKENSSRQGSQQKKGSDTHRSSAQDCASQCKDSTDASDCKD